MRSDDHSNLSEENPVTPRTPNFFTFIEFLKKVIAEKKDDAADKTIDDIPADRLELIKDYDPDAVIESFSDYIELLLDYYYSRHREMQCYWLHLMFGEGNNKFLEGVASANKIPLSSLYFAIVKRLLHDLENNFDEYEEFYDVKFV
jgi:hypothetical protein